MGPWKAAGGLTLGTDLRAARHVVKEFHQPQTALSPTFRTKAW